MREEEEEEEEREGREGLENAVEDGPRGRRRGSAALRESRQDK